MSEEWYIWHYNNKEYLHNKVLSFREFSESDGDHDHCELCWDRFSNYPDDLHNGYYEPLSGSWICEDCYNHLATLFAWSVEC